MKTKLLGILIAFAVLAPLTASAQVTLWKLNGTTLSPVNSTWDLEVNDLNLTGSCTGCGGLSGGTNGMLSAWTGATSLTATSGPTAAYFYATSSTATSTFPNLRVTTAFHFFTQIWYSLSDFAEYIADTVGAMVTGNTETGITVTYQDADNTFDFVVANLEDLAGTLDVESGGTEATTLTGILQGNGTSPFTTITNSSTDGQVLRVTGASTYAWGAINFDDTDAFTGTLPMSATQFVAGRSLTLSTDTVDADSELYTFTITAVLSATSTTDGISTTTEALVSVQVPVAATITGFECGVPPGTKVGTSTIKATVATDAVSTGTNILYTTGVRCGDDVATATSTFSTTAIGAGDWIRFWPSDASPTGARPGQITVSFTATKND